MTLGLLRGGGVLAQELEGHLDGLGAARGEVNAFETRPRESGEPLAQSRVRRVAGRARIRVGETATLVEHRLQDALDALAESREEGAGGHVEQPPSAVVDEMDAFARDDRRDVGCRQSREEQVLGAAAGRAEVASARFAIVQYPTDPRGTVTLSTTGRTHALLAAAAFLSLAVAAPTLGLTLASSPPWDRAGPVLAAVSVAVPVTVMATFAAGGLPSLRPLFGLAERAVYATGLSWLFVVSLGIAASPLTTQGT